MRTTRKRPRDELKTQTIPHEMISDERISGTVIRPFSHIENTINRMSVPVPIKPDMNLDEYEPIFLFTHANFPSPTSQSAVDFRNPTIPLYMNNPDDLLFKVFQNHIIIDPVPYGELCLVNKLYDDFIMKSSLRLNDVIRNKLDNPTDEKLQKVFRSHLKMYPAGNYFFNYDIRFENTTTDKDNLWGIFHWNEDKTDIIPVEFVEERIQYFKRERVNEIGYYNKMRKYENALRIYKRKVELHKRKNLSPPKPPVAPLLDKFKIKYSTTLQSLLTAFKLSPRWHDKKLAFYLISCRPYPMFLFERTTQLPVIPKSTISVLTRKYDIHKQGRFTDREIKQLKVNLLQTIITFCALLPIIAQNGYDNVFKGRTLTSGVDFSEYFKKHKETYNDYQLFIDELEHYIDVYKEYYSYYTHQKKNIDLPTPKRQRQIFDDIHQIPDEYIQEKEREYPTTLDPFIEYFKKQSPVSMSSMSSMSVTPKLSGGKKTCRKRSKRRKQTIKKLKRINNRKVKHN